MGFFKAFNSLQITALFAGFPFLIQWLHGAEFAGSVAAFWISLIVYVVFFFLMTASVFHSVDQL